jgi:hypothetical protein
MLTKSDLSLFREGFDCVFFSVPAAGAGCGVDRPDVASDVLPFFVAAEGSSLTFGAVVAIGFDAAFGAALGAAFDAEVVAGGAALVVRLLI